jgi:hypothetical protein
VSLMLTAGLERTDGNGDRFLLREMPEVMKHLSYRIVGEWSGLVGTALTRSRCQLGEGVYRGASRLGGY